MDEFTKDDVAAFESVLANLPWKRSAEERNAMALAAAGQFVVACGRNPHPTAALGQRLHLLEALITTISDADIKAYLADPGAPEDDIAAGWIKFVKKRRAELEAILRKFAERPRQN